MLDKDTKDLLPDTIRDAMDALTENTNATDEITLPTTLAVATFATQGIADAYPIQWERCSISNFFCVLVPSGGLKTSISDSVLVGARQFELEQREKAEEAETQYQIELKKYDSHIKEMAKKKDDPLNIPGLTALPTPFTKVTKPKFPRMARYMAGKFTLNGIINALKGVPHFGVFNSDAAEFFNSHAFTSKETSVEIISALSRLWSGEQIDKLTGVEDIITVGKRTTALFMLQQELANFFVNPQFKDQGFTNRILITQSHKITKKLADFTDEGISKKKTKDDKLLPFNNRVYELLKTVDVLQEKPRNNNLLEMRRQLLNQEDRDVNRLLLDTFPICMTDNTRLVYQDVYNDMTVKMEEEEYKQYQNFMSRAYEHFVRLANVLAIFDGKEMVTEREALCARGLIYYFIDQRMQLSINGEIKIDPIVHASEDLIDFLRKKYLTVEVTKTILNNYAPATYTKLNTKNRDRVLEELFSRDLITLNRDGRKVTIMVSK